MFSAYNAREYGANYHLLNTIALYDDFIPKGKTGLREYEKSA
ncbi:DNA adenine methylase [Helicobacter sp.]|nr:DNA adenine methylase [Helicobacter sp.]MDY5556376.1 DNA adenine methylase [Helicobacter sp.]